MIRFTPLARVGAALATGGLVLGLSAIPASSQVVVESSLSVSGVAECDMIEGEYVWVVGYEALNTSEIAIPANVTAALGDIDIMEQDVDLDGEYLFSTDLQPNPVPVDEMAFDGGALPGSFSGTLTLTVVWASPDTESSGTEVVTLELDDSCQMPVTTTTAGPAVQAEAVAVTPAFTG